MALKIYNTLTRKKEVFKPLKDKRVGFYLCGPTVYSAGHLGHARTYIIFDIIRKHLENSGFKVKFISNITDVHDDIIKKAKEGKTTIKEISDKFAEEFLNELKELRIKEADAYPRVSEYIPQIIDFVKILIEKEYAYEKNGSVYFDVSKFKKYGQLSGRKLEEAKSGTRVDVDKYERDEAADFALWKKTEPGDKEVGASWNSPWGEGRPGWHIECSVMSKTLLGEQFDIHGGAKDLIFPHHENEIAQSEAATGKSPFVKYWLHSGLLTVNGQKMSKSLNNFVTIKDVLQKHRPDVIRFWVLSANYRSPLDYSEEALKQTESSQKRISELVYLKYLEINKSPAVTRSKKIKELIDNLNKEIKTALDNDFNTPEALSAIFNFVRKINTFLNENEIINDQDIQDIKNAIFSYGYLTGIINEESAKQFVVPKKVLEREEINDLIRQYNEARKKKDYAVSDKIREKIKKKGFAVKDTLSGTIVTK